MKYKICTLIGTRPEAIKLAPVIKEIEKRKHIIKSTVIVTAQHREMLDHVLQLFSIKPKYDLDIMRSRQSLFDVTHRALRKLKPVLEKENPDILVIQGDTTTILVGALAAFYLKIPIAHVEAGLRTKDKYQPYPEEVNRRIATALADLHLAPTKLARDNLLHEGIPQEHIYVTGNTVIDAMLSVLDKKFPLDDVIFNKNEFEKKRMILITAHRRENWGRPLINICNSIKNIVDNFSDVIIMFSVHPNREVQRTVRKYLSNSKRIHLFKPLGYKAFVNLMAKAYIVLTDSGGIQEEAPLLKKPVLVVRNKTERQEAIMLGVAKLIGTEPERIFKETSRLLKDPLAYKAMIHHSPYGKGDAGKKIVKAILKYLKVSEHKKTKPVASIEPPLT